MAGLAARCTACGTVFRVVPDQLRVAGGLVRCGRCSAVFNAAESLIHLEAGTPVATPVAAATSHVPAEPGTDFDLQIAPPEPDLPDPPALPEPPEPEPTAAHPTEAAAHFALAPPDDGTETVPALGSRDPFFEEEAQHEIAFATTTLAEPQAEAAREVDPHAERDDVPSFVRSADRAQRWRSPRTRAGLFMLLLLGVLGIGTQATHSYRDLIAARWPQTRPVLDALCGALSCRIEPALSIESLAVESSGLVRVEKSGVYKLQVALRNRAAMGVAVPALDLTLSDAQGKPIARRVLRATELGVNMATLSAGRELAMQATLQAATEPVAGYTIELFYP